MSKRFKSMFDWLFADDSGKYVITQKPNLALIIGIASAVLARVLQGAGQHVASGTASATLGVWAFMEIYSGVNKFRRLLGIAVLVTSLVNAIALLR